MIRRRGKVYLHHLLFPPSHCPVCSSAYTVSIPLSIHCLQLSPTSTSSFLDSIIKMATQSSESVPTRLHGTTLVPLPRVAIKFCVQCKWNLRAAYVSNNSSVTNRLHIPSLWQSVLFQSMMAMVFVTVCFDIATLHISTDRYIFPTNTGCRPA